MAYRKGLSCAHPFERFDWGDVDIRCDVSSFNFFRCFRRVARSGTMNGVVQLTWAKTACWAVFLGAHMVVVSRLAKG